MMHLKLVFIPSYREINILEVKERALRMNRHFWHLIKVYNDGKLGVVSKGGDLLMDNDAKHSHHGSMAIVKHDGMLEKLGIGTKAILVPEHCA